MRPEDQVSSCESAIGVAGVRVGAIADVLRTARRRRLRGAFLCRCMAVAGVVAGLLLAPPWALAGSAEGPAALDAVDLSWIELGPAPDDDAKVDSAGLHTVFLDDTESRGFAEVWSLPLAGGVSTRLSGQMAPGDRVWAFSISPDGRWVAFTVSSGDGPRRLYRVPIVGGTPNRVDDDRFLLAEAGLFAFRGDSAAIGFLSGSDQVSVVVLLEEIFSNDFESGDASGWSDTTASACPTPTGGPTLHSSVASSQTWTANTSPHVLTANVLVPVGVTLTVAPCAEVRVRPGFDLTVQGTLVARGTPLQRIAFKRDNPSLPWDSIWVTSPGFADLAFLDLSGGGAAGASVIAEGNGVSPAALPLLADHLKVVGSTSLGVRLFQIAGFAAGSRDLVVSGSGATDPGAPYPVRMPLLTVGTLPTGTYTGNASDLISINEGNHVVEVDTAFHDRGIPYQIGGPAATFGVITIDGDPALATLTIEAGVEIRFYTQGSNVGGLFVGTSSSPVATGRLVATGTAAAPVLFTGAGGAPVAGSWEGITFFGALATGNLLDHVQIDAAGAHGGDQGFGCPPPPLINTDGALKIFSQPSAQFLTNSTISRSSTHGVFRAWTGAQVDFLAGNSFVDVAICNQVLPKPPPPAICPANPECPQ